MTLRTEASSSTINTRRAKERAKGIGSVATWHPVLAAFYTPPVKSGFFLFSQACCAWRDVIQAATAVNCSVIWKRGLSARTRPSCAGIHGSKARRSQSLGHSRAESRDSAFKYCSSDGSGPRMEQSCGLLSICPLPWGDATASHSPNAGPVCCATRCFSPCLPWHNSRYFAQ